MASAQADGMESTDNQAREATSGNPQVRLLALAVLRRLVERSEALQADEARGFGRWALDPADPGRSGSARSDPVLLPA